MYLKAGLPRPGDLVAFSLADSLFTKPDSWKLLRRTVTGELALVLGLDQWMERVLVMCIDRGTIGWARPHSLTTKALQ